MTFSALVVAAVFGVCLCQTYDKSGSLNGTGNGTDIQVFMQIKNCSLEAIYYTEVYFQFKCGFFNKQICNDNFKKCFKAQGYSSEKARDICQQEVGPNYLSEDMNADCEAGPSDYLIALQSTCCTKAKLVEQFPGRSFAETQDIIENCYDKVNCPGTDSCSETTP